MLRIDQKASPCVQNHPGLFHLLTMNHQQGLIQEAVVAAEVSWRPPGLLFLPRFQESPALVVLQQALLQ